MEVTELKMLRFSLGVKRMDKIRTGGMVWRENTRGKTEVVWTCTEERYWENDDEDGVARKEETGKAKMRFMDAVREDMTVVEVTEEDAEDRTK